MSPPPIDERSREEGAALILVLFMAMLLSGSVMALTLGVKAQSRCAVESAVHERQLRLADTGIAKAVVLAEVNYATYADYDGAVDLIGTSAAPVDGAWVTIEVVDGSASLPITFRLRSRGSVTGAGGSRTIELIYTISGSASSPLQGPGAGAVVGLGDFETSGNIQIDGRDHYEADSSVRSDGDANHVPGFTITGAISRGGNSKIGGGTEAPSKTPSEGIALDTTSSVWDLEDTGAASTDGLNADGEDNDGDGYIDENGFPTIWSQNLRVTYPHVFKTHAISKGTYFRFDGSKLYRHDGSDYVTDGDGNKITYDTWLATSDATDGGDVVLIEAGDDDDLGQFDLPSNGTGSPSVVIVQNQEWTAGWSSSGNHDTSKVDAHASHSDPYQDHNVTIGPLHVDQNETFKGMLVADNIHHTNGSGVLLGCIVAYNQSNLGHFGNGTFNVLFSSEVLGNLPGVQTDAADPVSNIQMWREVK